MNRYENICIIDPDVGEDDKNALLERIESQISRKDGALIEFDDWGVRKLAYEIRKKKQGQYVRTDFCGNGETVSSLEGMQRHDFRVLRFMTVKLEENVDPEAIKASREEKAGQKEAGSETAPQDEPQAESRQQQARHQETPESEPAGQQEEQ